MNSQDHNRFYTYALLDPRKPGPFFYGHWKFSHEPFYVGKGMKGRAWCHTGLAVLGRRVYNPHKNRKIKSVVRSGLNPIVLIKRRNLTEEEAFDLEKLLIKKIGRHNLRTGPLTNLSEGGDGAAGRVMSRKQKETIRSQVKIRMANLSEKEKQERGSKISIGLIKAVQCGKRDPIAMGKKIAEAKWHGPSLKGMSERDQEQVRAWYKKYSLWRNNARRFRVRIHLSCKQFIKLAVRAGLSSADQVGRSFQLIRTRSEGDYTFRDCKFVSFEEARLNQTLNGKTRS